jgi:hypothetical protein
MTTSVAFVISYLSIGMVEGGNGCGLILGTTVAYIREGTHRDYEKKTSVMK